MTDDKLPTIGEALSNWLGVQLPALNFPQTLKNLDKAIGKVVLAGGDNIATHIRNRTAKTKARGKIETDEMFRSEDERRKLENKAAITREALEEFERQPNDADAKAEIEDDWLNTFSRLAEDKSSEELQHLFGKILAGEIKQPGTFSLRTLQLLSMLSKHDAQAISDFLSFAIAETVVMFRDNDDQSPTPYTRVLMESLGIAGHPSRIGGMSLKASVAPVSDGLWSMAGKGLYIRNATAAQLKFELPGQPLTPQGRELLKIANPKETDDDYLKSVVDNVYGQIRATLSNDTAVGAVYASGQHPRHDDYREALRQQRRPLTVGSPSNSREAIR